jgi:hypothetical protein
MKHPFNADTMKYVQVGRLSKETPRTPPLVSYRWGEEISLMDLESEEPVTGAALIN